MKYIRVIIMFFLVSHNFLVAQIPGMRVYNESDGYTASIGYIINQDPTGFIWIGSNKGAIQFDGHQFNIFDERSGLKDKEVTQAISCKGGFVFITPLVNMLAYYSDGCIINEDRDSLLSQPKNVGLNQLAADRITGNCWLGDLKNQGFLYRFEMGKLKKIKIDVEPSFSLVGAHNNWLILRIEQNLVVYHTLTHRLLPFEFSGDTSIFKNLSLCAFSPDGKYMFAYSKHQLALYRWQNINQLTFIRSFPAQLVPKQIIIDQYNGLWTTYKEAGVDFWGFIDNYRMQASPLRLFPSTVINDVFCDRDQNLWFTTKRQGLYFIPALQWQNYLNALKVGIDPALPTLVGGNEADCVFLGFENSPKLGVIQKGKYSEFRLGPEMSEGVHTLSAKKNLACISTTSGNLNLIKLQAEELHVQQKYNLPGSVKDIHFQRKNHTLYAASNSGAQTLSFDQLSSPALTTLFPYAHRSTSILPLPNGILLGTPDGLYQRLSSDTTFKRVCDKTLQHANITDLASFDEEHALVGTMADGLFQYHYANEQAWPISLNRHQHPGVIHQIFKESPLHYWLATDQGVYRIALKEHKAIHIAHYGFADGLPSSSVSSLYVLHDTLYAATSGGLAVIPIKNKRKIASPRVMVLKANIQDSIVFLPHELSFSYPLSNLSFMFSAFAFSHPGKIKYRYTLKGHSTQWVTSSTPLANFSDLTPGQYAFLVGVAKPNKLDETPLTQISVTVHPAFWQTVWFKGLYVVVLLLFASGTFYYALKKRREKAFLKLKQKRKLAELELEAIKAQINPHFIGNCLNSIQYLAYKNDYESVGLYLDHFSSLIKQTMELSQKMFTSLQNELAYLTNYLELEKMRFKERLDYSIHVEKGIGKMRLLPAMLLQPYVENALKHGGVHRGKQGKIHIEIGTLANGWLHVSITDNGKGVKKETAYRNSQKLGLRLSGSRVKTYNELFNLGIELCISPRSKLSEHHESGTLVQLKIPPINYENTYV